MLRTPKNKSTVLILTFLVYTAVPFVNAYSIYRDFLAGAFPPESDAIAIPIVGFFFFWILFAPIAWSFVIWAIWKYPGKVSLFGFNRNQLFLSFTWSAIFAFLFFTALFSAIESLSKPNFIESTQLLSIAYLALIFRATIVFRK